MKVLVMSAAFPPMKAGEADHAMHLCHHLAARGLDVHVLTTKSDLQTNHFPFALYPIMPNWQWSDLPRLVRFLKQCSPDAILFMYTPRDYNYSPMIIFAPTIIKTILPRARFVTQFETELVGAPGSVLGRATRKAVAKCLGQKKLDYVFGTLLSESQRFIVLSERHLAALGTQFRHVTGNGIAIPPPPLLRMCPEENGAARQRGREALGVKPDDFLIAYYGYLYAEKGIETLFQALHILTGKRYGTYLVMIGGDAGEKNHGSSYLDSLMGLAKSLGITNKVIWTGEYAPDSDEPSLYLRAADAGVFPFNYGVTLNRSSVAAAAAHKLPIVTTKSSTLESAFIDGENVLLCPPRDPNALADAVESLITSPALRQELSAGSFRLAAEWFRWDKAVERTIQVLQT